MPVFKKSSANGEKVSPLWGSASVAALGADTSPPNAAGAQSFSAAKPHQQRQLAPFERPSAATLAQALCADTFERSTSATLFFVFFSFRTGNFKKLLYMI